MKIKKYNKKIIKIERKAIIRSVHVGHRGKYAVTSLVLVSTSISGSITFLLEKPVWTEDYLPEEGTFVMLSNLCRKQRGWRAMKARPWNTQDEKAMRKKGALQ